jgi:hypothetical protein
VNALPTTSNYLLQNLKLSSPKNDRKYFPPKNCTFWGKQYSISKSYMVNKSQHIQDKYVAHIKACMMHVSQQIQHEHVTHNFITKCMDREHDDVHLNIIQLLI